MSLVKPFLATDPVTTASGGHGNPLAVSRLLERRPLRLLRPLEPLEVFNGLRSGSRVRTRDAEVGSPTHAKDDCTPQGPVVALRISRERPNTDQSRGGVRGVARETAKGRGFAFHRAAAVPASQVSVRGGWWDGNRTLERRREPSTVARGFFETFKKCNSAAPPPITHHRRRCLLDPWCTRQFWNLKGQNSGALATDLINLGLVQTGKVFLKSCYLRVERDPGARFAGFEP